MEGRKGRAQPDMGMHNLLHVFLCVEGGGEEKPGVFDMRIKLGRKESSRNTHFISITSIDKVKNQKHQHFYTSQACWQ